MKRICMHPQSIALTAIKTSSNRTDAIIAVLGVGYRPSQRMSKWPSPIHRRTGAVD
jgi:hypothetical protein